MSETIWVLQVEDSESDAALVRRHLEKAGYEVYSERVDDAENMRAALTRTGWDIIICDYHIPQFGAPAALHLLQEMHQDVPFIVVSGVAGEEVAVETMRLGARDYVMKDKLQRLAPAVERELRDARNRLLAAQAEKELAQSELRNREQQETLDRQTEALRRTETVLQEIHHRVRNNLQVIGSLLRLQARAAANEQTRELLQDLDNRIRSMALLHESLYDSENVGLVDFPRYIESVTRYLLSSNGARREHIRMHTELAPLALDIDVALPCGLILNEAISNSLRHGFPEGRKGEIRIVLEKDSSGSATLLVADDGAGIAEPVDPAHARSLGFRLMNMMTRQLNATLDIQSRYGTEVRLLFAIAPQTNASDRPVAVGH